jgi:hypothetical protein
LATLVAFVHCLEATTQDEALEVFEMLLHDLFVQPRSNRSTSPVGMSNSAATCLLASLTSRQSLELHACMQLSGAESQPLKLGE